MIDAQASKTFDAALEGADTGLVGTIGVRVVDGPAGTTLVARRTAGITEYPAGSGVYNVTLTAPPAPGGYLVLWDTGEPLTPAGTFTEELNVYAGPPPSAPGGTLASLDDFKRYLRAAGTVSAGGSLDEELLKSLLRASESRVRAELRDRTLDVLPASESDPPVEIRVPLTGYAQRIVQVPDLRELSSITVVGGSGYGGDVIDVPGAPAWSAPSLMRAGRERSAVWLRFPAAVWGTELAIVGRWGPAGVREDEPLAPSPAVVEAIIVWAARAFHNRTARYADTVQDPAGGVTQYFRNLPPDVATTIDGLRVPGV